MDVTMINEVTDERSMLPESMIDRPAIDDVLDISVLTSFEDADAHGEPDLVVELIDLYLEDVPEKLKAMRRAQALMDAHSLRGAAHGLKGSSSTLGVRQMAALCDELEASADDLSSQEINSFLTRIEHEFARVRVAFAAERHRRLS